MSVNKKGIERFYKNLQKLKKEIPNALSEIIIAEGRFAVTQAKKICKNDKPDVVNTGNYRANWHTGNKALEFNGKDEHDGSKPAVRGGSYKIDVYNNTDYASYIEHGFRSHFVPGKWKGRTFVYMQGYRDGGMQVGKPGEYVPGRFVLKRAINNTKATQTARMNRKLNAIIRRYAGK